MLINLLPLSTIDYPGKRAAVLYYSGCNFQCTYCKNVELAKNNIKPQITIKEVLSYLKKQRGQIDAVCFTGGEPLLTKDLVMIIRTIKAMGFLTKIDTNGSNLKALKIIAPYLNYISIELKSDPELYDVLTKHQGSWAKVRETMSWVMKSSIPHEFRTTVLPELHDGYSLRRISNIVGDSSWYLQQYNGRQNDALDERNYERYDDKELYVFAKALKCQVRDYKKRRYLYEGVTP